MLQVRKARGAVNIPQVVCRSAKTRRRIGNPAWVVEPVATDTTHVAVPVPPGVVTATLVEAAAADTQGRLPIPLGVSQTGVSAAVCGP